MNKRFKKLMKELEKVTTSEEKKVVSAYIKTLQKIFRLLETYYRQYEVDGKLTMEEMVKYNRLKNFEDDLIRLLIDLNKTVGNTVVKHLKYLYSEGYYRSAWIVETETLAKLSYSMVTAEVLESAIQHNFTGLTLNQRLQRNRDDVILKLREVVTRGLYEGQTLKDMSKSIQHELEMSATKSNRIVRTESHRLIQQSSLDAATHATKKGVVMQKEWMNMKDERVRPGRGIGKKDGKGKADHRKLDGVKLPIDGVFDDGLSKGPAPGQLPAAGSSVNCRCILLYSVDRIEKPQHDDLKDMPLERWKKERLTSNS